MATREDHGAEGYMMLKYHFYESASGHVEESNSTMLKAIDDNTIQLIEEDSYVEYLKKHGNENNKISYKISVEEIIKLIKEHGVKI